MSAERGLPQCRCAYAGCWGKWGGTYGILECARQASANSCQPTAFSRQHRGLPVEPCYGPGVSSGGLDLAVARSGGGHERAEQFRGRQCYFVDREVEGLLVCRRGLGEAADFPHELGGGRPDFRLGCRWFEVVKRLDVSAHRLNQRSYSVYESIVWNDKRDNQQGFVNDRLGVRLSLLASFRN